MRVFKIYEFFAKLRLRTDTGHQLSCKSCSPQTGCERWNWKALKGTVARQLSSILIFRYTPIKSWLSWQWKNCQSVIDIATKIARRILQNFTNTDFNFKIITNTVLLKNLLFESQGLHDLEEIFSLQKNKKYKIKITCHSTQKSYMHANLNICKIYLYIGWASLYRLL